MVTITAHRPLTVLASLVLLTAGLASLPGSSADEPEQGVMTVTSFDGTEIEILVCKPDAASASTPAPVILHSHGWGGSRASDCGGFSEYLDRDLGVVSITQRGFGNSTNESHVHDPDLEGRDNIAVIDRVASLSWVQTEDEAGNDPVLGAVGGSYGGGYQFITALTEIERTGETRLDALTPQITWYSLPQSLWPNGVVRSVWVDALYAAGAANVHQGIHEAFAYGTATGQPADGTVPGVHNIVADFHENSPVGFVDQGLHLDIPILVGQGLTDNLFNLNQGVHNVQDTLTQSAREDSYLIGYNGGHALPNVLPPGTMTSGDPCSQEAGYDDFNALALAFLENQLTNAANPMPQARYNLATDGGACTHADSIDELASYDVGPAQVAVTPTGAGAPVYLPVTQGPLSIAGIPRLNATLTTVGADQRAFAGLAVGSSPAEAQVLSNNLLPINRLTPVVQEDMRMELPGVAVNLAEGETLYLVLTPVSDMFAHHGSRTPGSMLLENVTVDLPVAS